MCKRIVTINQVELCIKITKFLAGTDALSDKIFLNVQGDQYDQSNQLLCRIPFVQIMASGHMDNDVPIDISGESQDSITCSFHHDSISLSHMQSKAILTSDIHSPYSFGVCGLESTGLSQ